jgi:hypothetical protein
MNIKWRILELNKATGSIVVNFFDDTLLPVGVSYNFDLPITNGALPSEEAIKAMVNAQIPMHIFDRIVQLQSTIDSTSVEEMMSKTYIAEPPIGDIPPIEVIVQPAIGVENV